MNADADAFATLFEALDEVEEALHLAHQDLPLAEHAHPQNPSVLLADVVLILIDNLRAATRGYRREAHLARHFPSN